MGKKKTRKGRYQAVAKKPENNSSEAPPPKHPVKDSPEEPELNKSMFFRESKRSPSADAKPDKRLDGVASSKKVVRNKEEQARNPSPHLQCLVDATNESQDVTSPEDQVGRIEESGTSTQELTQLSSSMAPVPENQKSLQTEWVKQMEDQQNLWKTELMNHQHNIDYLLEEQKKDMDVLKESLAQLHQSLEDQQRQGQKAWDSILETQEEHKNILLQLYTELKNKTDDRPKKKSFFQRLIKNVTKLIKNVIKKIKNLF